MSYLLRPLAPADESLLWPLLAVAAHEMDVATVAANPLLAQYATGWGRPGDSGCVALDESGIPAGAAWLRLWTGELKGFGYLDPATPELAMAVLPAHRNRGLGTQLLQRILDATRGVHPAVSLNVRAENPAVRLYERAGFAKVAGSECLNRTGGVSFNMVYRCAG